MVQAVSDTGPINYLILIEQVDLLSRLFECTIISATVRQELSEPGAPSAVRAWIRSPPSWLRITPDAASSREGSVSLDDGERATIDLASKLHTGTVLMNDRAGARFARSRGFAAVGTLGLLLSGARNGFLDLGEAFAAFRTTSFYAPSELFDSLLAQHDTGDR